MSKASILITDDESNIRLMLRTALESDGYSVAEAPNGRAALEAIAHRTPDLMVLDLNMPEIDGMAVLEQMQNLARAHRPRVIILTAYGSIPAAVRATRMGAVDFLEKPVTPAELRAAVRSVLEEPLLDDPDSIPVTVSVYENALDRARKSLRMADYSSAESILMKAAECGKAANAPYYNLLGVLYETQRKWRLARKCYEKAIDAQNEYEPARINLRRLIQMISGTPADIAPILGDEIDMQARLPHAGQRH